MERTTVYFQAKIFCRESVFADLLLFSLSVETLKESIKNLFFVILF